MGLVNDDYHLEDVYNITGALRYSGYRYTREESFLSRWAKRGYKHMVSPGNKSSDSLTTEDGDDNTVEWKLIKKQRRSRRKRK